MRESINNLFPDSIVWSYKGSVLFAMLLGAAIAGIWFTLYPPHPEPTRYERQWFFVHKQPLLATPLDRQHQAVSFYRNFARHYGYTYNERRDALGGGGFWFYHSSVNGTGFVVAQELDPYRLETFRRRLSEWAEGQGKQFVTDDIALDLSRPQAVLEKPDPGINSIEAGMLVGGILGGLVGAVYSFLATFMAAHGWRPFGIFS